MFGVVFNVLTNVDPECSFFFSLPLSLPLFPTRAYTRIAYLIIIVRFDRSLLRRKRWNMKREKNGMLKKAACEKFLKGVGGLYTLFCTTTTRNIGLKIFESLFKLVLRYIPEFTDIYIKTGGGKGEREKPPLK